MTSAEWIEVGTLEELPEGRVVLRKAGGRRFACVRRGDAVDALDDRCPHQGYPLSQGTVRDGELTCCWHNWKFDLSSGACTFGGDAARRFPSRVEAGRVYLDVRTDLAAEAARAERGLREALFEEDVPRAVRDGLRLGAARPGPAELGPVGAALAVAVRDAAERAPWGFAHDLSVTADVATFVERGELPPAEGLAAVATLVGGTSPARPPRPHGEAAHLGDLADLLREERREEAERTARALARDGGLGAVIDAAAPFLAADLLDYGHGAIHAAKALELQARFPAEAEPIAGALAVMLGWATAETRLPPFAATQRALASLRAPGGDRRPTPAERATTTSAILEGERAAIDAIERQLAAGADPRELLRIAARAAAIRVLRFDRAWERRADAEAGLLDVTHAVTFAEAALTLSARPAMAPHAGRLALLAAAFVGKLRRGDGPPPVARPGAALAEALERRDLGLALGAVRGSSREDRGRIFRELVPFAVHEAFVRPIFVAHAIKMLEALRRLDADAPDDDAVHLEALLATIVPRARERNGPRVAQVAARFLADGRPPEGLY